MTKTPKPKPKICRSFRQDFPEFVARAEALDVSIQLEKGRRDGWDRVYWLEGYRQLTGYTTNSDGSRFTHSDAVKNIDRILSRIEADRQVIAGMTVPERFERVMVEMRKIVPQSGYRLRTFFGMIGEAKLPCGDGGYCFFACGLVNDFQGGVRLKGMGEVARAKAEFRYGETGPDRMARFCAALEADFAARSASSEPSSGSRPAGPCALEVAS